MFKDFTTKALKRPHSVPFTGGVGVKLAYSASFQDLETSRKYKYSQGYVKEFKSSLKISLKAFQKFFKPLLKENNHEIFKKACAFTLAEVLITIGIIGVVAVITLPSLLTRIQNNVRARQIQMIKTKFTKATTTMNIDGKIGPYYDDTEAFVKELSKYLKIVTICTSDNLRSCWPYDKVILEDGSEYDITKAKTGQAFKMYSDTNHSYKTPNVGIVTADGTPMIISFNTKCEALDPDINYSGSDTNATTGCVSAIFDINGSSSPNKFGTDVVAFNANGLGGSCAFDINGKCFGSMFYPMPLTQEQCEAQKGALGIKYCELENDYWAGAAAQCGGVDKMATLSDLAQLANTFYSGNQNFGAKDSKYDLSYDINGFRSLGLSTGEYVVRSGEETSSTTSSSRYFNPTYTIWYITNRGTSWLKALCIID
jgi:type II secretory pathway pseudopilin PulG